MTLACHISLDHQYQMIPQNSQPRPSFHQLQTQPKVSSSAASHISFPVIQLRIIVTKDLLGFLHRPRMPRGSGVVDLKFLTVCPIKHDEPLPFPFYFNFSFLEQISIITISMHCLSFLVLLTASSLAAATLNPCTSNTQGECPQTYNCSGITHIISTHNGSLLTCSMNSSESLHRNPSSRMLPQHPHIHYSNLHRLRHRPSIR
jgi:hypothetical protein